MMALLDVLVMLGLGPRFEFLYVFKYVYQRFSTHSTFSHLGLNDCVWIEPHMKIPLYWPISLRFLKFI